MGKNDEIQNNDEKSLYYYILDVKRHYSGETHGILMYSPVYKIVAQRLLLIFDPIQ